MCLPMQVKLVQHTYSCLFGTFLCNSGKERVDLHIQERTCSVWSLLRPANRSLRNMLYSSHSEIVRTLPVSVMLFTGSQKDQKKVFTVPSPVYFFLCVLAP